MIYLTYNDPPSGIYYSQVTDVCNYLNEKFDANIRLVSLISMRGFFENKKKIKLQKSDAIVIPMFPRVTNWRLNIFYLLIIFLFLDSRKVIARGPFAASLAIRLKIIGAVKWVCFDARGAYDAELNEYDVAESKAIKRDIFEIEKRIVLNSDFRIAVSNELVRYWKDRFNYSGARHVVIPCTLNSKIFGSLPEEAVVKKNKNELGFSDKDIVLVYSGSTAGWQSIKLVDDFLFDLLEKNENAKVLFLARSISDKMKIWSKFKNRIVCKWLEEADVPDVLSCCDYGILIREKSITNKVASPVKFAEYLASGLKIVISEEVGDYTKFVLSNGCGIILDKMNEQAQFKRVSFQEKMHLNILALKHFSKNEYVGSYQLLF